MGNKLNNCCSNFDYRDFELDSMQNRNWMEKFHQQIKNIRLIDQIIPGSHDSGSYSIDDSKFGSPVYITQRLRIFDQLCLGARYLDIRYGPGRQNPDSAENIKVMHQMYHGNSLASIQDEIDQFLLYNPKEFIMINIQQERQINNSQKNFMFNKISSQFKNKLITKKDFNDWFDQSNVTIGNILSNNKNIFILTCDKLGLGMWDAIEPIGFFNKDNLILNNWHNVDNIQVLLNKIDNEIDDFKFSNNRNRKLHIHQIILTPQIVKIPEFIVCCDAPRLDKFNKKLNEESVNSDEISFPVYMQKNIQKHWNIVLLDFLEIHQKQIDFLVKSNCSKKMYVIGAFLGKVDVGQMLRDQVTKINCIFIPYPYNFFAHVLKYINKSPDQLKLIIKICFTGDKSRTIKVSLNKPLVFGYDFGFIEKLNKPKKKVELIQDQTWKPDQNPRNINIAAESSTNQWNQLNSKFFCDNSISKNDSSNSISDQQTTPISLSREESVSSTIFTPIEFYESKEQSIQQSIEESKPQYRKYKTLNLTEIKEEHSENEEDSKGISKTNANESRPPVINSNTFFID